MNSPSEKLINKVLINKDGDWLEIKATYRANGVRWFVVDSDNKKLFDYLADRLENLEDFIDFIYRTIRLDESEFISLLKAFNFSQDILKEFSQDIKAG